MIIYFRQIFDEMCKRVGLPDSKNLDIKKEGWYEEYSWTAKDAQKFRDWLTEYFKKDKGAFYFFRDRKYPHNRAQCKLLAEYIVTKYGWKIK